jgi:hypothetical protein
MEGWRAYDTRGTGPTVLDSSDRHGRAFDRGRIRLVGPTQAHQGVIYSTKNKLSCSILPYLQNCPRDGPRPMLGFFQRLVGLPTWHHVVRPIRMDKFGSWFFHMPIDLKERGDLVPSRIGRRNPPSSSLFGSAAFRGRRRSPRERYLHPLGARLRNGGRNEDPLGIEHRQSSQLTLELELGGARDIPKRSAAASPEPRATDMLTRWSCCGSPSSARQSFYA